MVTFYVISPFRAGAISFAFSTHLFLFAVVSHTGLALLFFAAVLHPLRRIPPAKYILLAA